MHKRHKYDIITFLAVGALLISTYLTVTHYLGQTVPCTVTHGCETVLHSKYATVIGLPLSLWGMGYFIGIVFLSLLANHYVVTQKLLTIMLSVGALVSLVLLSLQFFVIGKVCQYCFIVDITSITLFLWDLNIEHSLFASKN